MWLFPKPEQARALSISLNIWNFYKLSTMLESNEFWTIRYLYKESCVSWTICKELEVKHGQMKTYECVCTVRLHLNVSWKQAACVFKDSVEIDLSWQNEGTNYDALIFKPSLRMNYCYSSAQF